MSFNLSRAYSKLIQTLSIRTAGVRTATLTLGSGNSSHASSHLSTEKMLQISHSTLREPYSSGEPAIQSAAVGWSEPIPLGNRSQTHHLTPRKWLILYVMRNVRSMNWQHL